MSDAGRSAGLDGFAECERLLAEGDPERAVSVGFAPADRRDALNALYAFNLETARVRDHVSQPLPGEIRLQWWRDRIEADPGSEEPGQGSPVAAALVETIRRHDLPTDAFDRFLEARIFDLYDDPMPSVTDFEAYAGQTASTLIVLASMVLDRAEAHRITEAAGHAGVAQLAVGVLRLATIHRRRNQVFVPVDLLASVGTDAADWLAGGEGAKRAEAAMAALAADHLEKARTHLRAAPRQFRPAFLPALLTSRHLAKLDRDSPQPVGPLDRLWFYWRSMRG
ncbi:phytoene/squalene synthase family protein [Aureimonas sp. AU4]|uniref:phytoene/squalene synthase family protein n=1 Tax=Aureimonas sp. AU4 TaxID=1638163 RepID=UPI0007824A3B|nr:phytoene/squalene synthase family protein [Aureimonas sp. AU4]